MKQANYLSPALAAAMLASIGAYASAASSPAHTLVTEPDQGLTPIYNLISSAKHSIDMTMYALQDTTAEKLLGAAAAKGVTVRVILDQDNEKSNNQAAYTYLSKHGVKVHWANTAYTYTHQKTITIDGTTSAIMTLNLQSQYYSSSRDFAVIETDANDVTAIENTFDADFINSAVTPATGDDLVWSPTNAQSALLNIINSATTSLQVENEEMADTNITNALTNAAQRGVNVTIIMTANSSYDSALDTLKSAGAQIATYAASAPLYIHAKVILADYGTSNARIFLGSENFSSTSLTQNRELGLIINDSALMSSVNTALASDYQGGTPY